MAFDGSVYGMKGLRMTTGTTRYGDVGTDEAGGVASTRRALDATAAGRDEGSERFVRVEEDEDDESDALAGDAGAEANKGADDSGSGNGSGDGGTEDSRDEGSGQGEEGDCTALRMWSISAKAWSMAPWGMQGSGEGQLGSARLGGVA